MSGQIAKTHADVNKKRNEYMENLSLQEEINDMNLQANKTYLLSGQLPPQSQMQDTRTTSEKLKDVESMKQSIASDFAGTIDPTSIYALINKIIESPLNLNNSLFRFFTQRASSIAEQYKKLYPLGIEGDANDIARIYEYIKNMYSDTQGKFQSTKSYMNSMSTNISNRIIGSNDLDIVLAQLDDCIKNIQFTVQKGINIGLPNLTILNVLRQKIFELKQTIPNTEQMNRLMGEFTSSANVIENNIRRIHYEEFFSLLEKLPKYNEVIALINKINQFILGGNFDTAIDGINRLKDMFGLLFERNTQRIYDNFYQYYKRPMDIESEQMRQLSHMQTIQNIEQANLTNRENAKAKRVYIVNSYDDPIYVRNAMNLSDLQSVSSNRNSGSDDNSSDFPSVSGDSSIMANSRGNGLKRRGRPRGSGISEKLVLNKKPNFIGFGINEINQKQLDKGLVKVRRNTKSNYMDMPTKRVSTNMQNILKTITGGGVPNYNDLSKLDEEEKSYLNKLVSRSELTDRISVPAPSKDQEEKDIHNFEVMRGQIMSGNDSQEIVKKFKLLIRKLSKQGLLPKNEVDDLLMLLIELGY